MPRSGNTTQRGYGYRHQLERARWAPLVAAGDVACSRCRLLIDPAEPWDLGHDDDDRSVYRGPEHARCNRGAAATIGNRLRRLGRARRRRSAIPVRQSWEL